MLVFTIQPVPSSITTKMSPEAPNSMGVTTGGEPQMLVLLHFHWKDTEDDERMYGAAESWLRSADREAEGRGGRNAWVYLNYAHEGQRPMHGYGKGGLERLRAVSGKFDPSGFFQRCVRGGFKLWD